MKLPESTATIRSAGRIVVQSRGEHPRVDRRSSDRSSYGTSLHRASRGDRGSGRRRCGTRSRRTPPRPVDVRRGGRDVADHTRGRSAGARRARRPRGRPGPPCAVGPISVPCRVVHMFSAQPQPTTRSASRISSAASGEANPPEMPSDERSPANSPLATAEVASSAPERRAERRATRGPAPRAPRPATKTGRSRPRSGRGQFVDRSGRGRTGAGTADRRQRGVRRRRLACTSSGRFSTTVRRSLDGGAVGPDDVGDAPIRPCAPGPRPRRPRVASASWSMRKLERTAGRGGVGGEHDQRGAALRGLGDAGHRVGQPAALMHGEHRGPAGHPRLGVGHRRGAALVPGGDERDTGGAQRVGDVEVAAADHAEGVADTEPRQCRADEIGDGCSLRLDQRQHPRRAAGAADDRQRRRRPAPRRSAGSRCEVLQLGQAVFVGAEQ